jgi:hypothetical protein
MENSDLFSKFSLQLLAAERPVVTGEAKSVSGISPIALQIKRGRSESAPELAAPATTIGSIWVGSIIGVVGGSDKSRHVL